MTNIISLGTLCPSEDVLKKHLYVKPNNNVSTHVQYCAKCRTILQQMTKEFYTTYDDTDDGPRRTTA